jgi:hypothetical protein
MDSGDSWSPKRIMSWTILRVGEMSHAWNAFMSRFAIAISSGPTYVKFDDGPIPLMGRGGHKQGNSQGPCQDLAKDGNKDWL